MKFVIVKSKLLVVFLAKFHAFKRMREREVLSCSLFSWST